jgi:hypothetical protein
VIFNDTRDHYFWQITGRLGRVKQQPERMLGVAEVM